MLSFFGTDVKLKTPLCNWDVILTSALPVASSNKIVKPELDALVSVPSSKIFSPISDAEPSLKLVHQIRNAKKWKRII